MPPQFLHEMAPQQVMGSPSSWTPREDLPTEVYEGVTAAKSVTFADARRNGFSLRIK